MPDIATLGLYGLFTIGNALAHNILDNGFGLHAFNRSADAVPDFIKEVDGEGLANKLIGTKSLDTMIVAMPSLRSIIIIVWSGKPVDVTIKKLKPLLAKNDKIIG